MFKFIGLKRKNKHLKQYGKLAALNNFINSKPEYFIIRHPEKGFRITCYCSVCNGEELADNFILMDFNNRSKKARITEHEFVELFKVETVEII